MTRVIGPFLGLLLDLFQSSSVIEAHPHPTLALNWSEYSVVGTEQIHSALRRPAITRVMTLQRSLFAYRSAASSFLQKNWKKRWVSFLLVTSRTV